MAAMGARPRFFGMTLADGPREFPKGQTQRRLTAHAPSGNCLTFFGAISKFLRNTEVNWATRDLALPKVFVFTVKGKI